MSRSFKLTNGATVQTQTQLNLPSLGEGKSSTDLSAYVRWQVRLRDPIRQVTLRRSKVDFL